MAGMAKQIWTREPRSRARGVLMGNGLEALDPSVHLTLVRRHTGSAMTGANVVRRGGLRALEVWGLKTALTTPV